MRRPRTKRLAIAGRLASVGALATVGLLGGCGSAPQPPHGAPLLLSAFWIAGGVQIPIYSYDGSLTIAPGVPGGGSEVDFVFDRRLDGSRIENVVGDTTMPKANPPITLTWPTGPAIPKPTTPPFDDVFYNSVAAFGGVSSYVFLRPRMKGFPSATVVTFTLDSAGLTSVYGEPMNGPMEIDVSVAPLAVVPRVLPGADALETVSTTFALPVRFTNRPAAAATLAPFMHARAGGAELPVAVGADVTEPTLVYVSPARCLGGWPAGATVEVSFAAGFPDAFNVPSATELAGGSFTVAGSGGGDGSAGGGDGGSCDGPIDAGAGTD